jgi:dihydrofolate reductase
MRRLVLQEWLSLDGFAADRDGEASFIPSSDVDGVSDRDQLRFLDRVDTVLLGRKTYELFAAFWPTATTDQEMVADRLNALPKVVFSNTLTEAPWGRWPPARVMSGDAVSRIRTMKQEAGKCRVLWGSLSLAQALIAADLVDEYHLQVCPTILGAGRALFPTLESRAALRRVDVRTYDTGVVFLRYEPERGA